MSEKTILVYGSDWCGDCRRAKRFLNQHQVPYHWIDIERDKQGEQFVILTNRGMRIIPIIVFPDGSVLVEPSNSALAEKLGFSVLA